MYSINNTVELSFWHLCKN